jgi:prepilin-type N-terminal cleavage/methylation domain-containing protein
MRIQGIVRPSLRRRPGARSGKQRSRFGLRGESGFSMIEVTVAIAVFGLVATFMSHLLAGGLKGVLVGKRREVAIQEANRVLEIARSLSYDAVGLVESDATLAGDPAVQQVNDVAAFQYDAELEPVMWATNPDGHPFDPHIAEVDLGATELIRYVYVTGVDSDNNDTIDMKRLTVRVAWSKDGAAGPENQVVTQTLVNESGLVSTTAGSTTTTPLTAKAQSTGPSLSLKSARGDIASNTNAELPTDAVTVALPTTSGKTTFRAISDINCSATSATFTGTNTYGGHSVTVTADDDGRTATSSQPTSQSWSGSDSINNADDVDGLIAESTVASPVSCAATTADQDGQLPTDDTFPYEKGTASALGTLNATEDVSGMGLPSSTLTAASIVTAPISQELDRHVVSGNGELLSNTTVAHGTVHVMKLPSVFSEGLVRVDGITYGASARGAVGTPSAAPAVTAPTINLRVYDVGGEVSGCSNHDNNYCVLAINPSANGFAGRVIDFEHSIVPNGGQTRLEYQVHVDVQPPVKDALAGVIGPNGEKRWTAAYTPISISTRLRIFYNNAGTEVLVTDTASDLSLGSVRAEACAGVTCL